MKKNSNKLLIHKTRPIMGCVRIIETDEPGERKYSGEPIVTHAAYKVEWEVEWSNWSDHREHVVKENQGVSVEDDFNRYMKGESRLIPWWRDYFPQGEPLENLNDYYAFLYCSKARREMDFLEYTDEWLVCEPTEAMYFNAFSAIGQSQDAAKRRSEAA